MNIIDKMFVSFFVVMFIIFTILTIMVSMDLNEKSKQCSEVNGVVVKTSKGYKCLDVRVVE